MRVVLLVIDLLCQWYIEYRAAASVGRHFAIPFFDRLLFQVFLRQCLALSLLGFGICLGCLQIELRAFGILLGHLLIFYCL